MPRRLLGVKWSRVGVPGLRRAGADAGRPPGNYVLFALDANGTPSVAAVMNIQ